jgi:hypothetical protein
MGKKCWTREVLPSSDSDKSLKNKSSRIFSGKKIRELLFQEGKAFFKIAKSVPSFDKKALETFLLEYPETITPLIK